MFRITSNSPAKYGGGYPPEVLVDDDLITGTDEEIDEALPVECRTAGTIIFTADFDTVKQRNFDGEWVAV